MRLKKRAIAQCFSTASERSKIHNSKSKRRRAMKLVSIKSSCCVASYEGLHISKSHVKTNLHGQTWASNIIAERVERAAYVLRHLLFTKPRSDLF